MAKGIKIGTNKIDFEDTSLKTSVGDLDTLDTEEKSSVVGAINELSSGKQDTLTAGDGISIDDNNEISVDPMPADDMSNIIDPLPIFPADKSNEDYYTKEEIDAELDTAKGFSTNPTENIVYYNGYPLFMTTPYLNIYVNSDTGADDIDSGYGFSADKPFKTLRYAFSKIPALGLVGSSSITQHYSGNVCLNLSGTFEASTLTKLQIHELHSRLYIQPTTSNDTVTFKNITFYFSVCPFVQFQNGTFNFEYTITSTSAQISAIEAYNTSYVSISATINVKGNSTLYNYLKDNNICSQAISTGRASSVTITSTFTITYFMRICVATYTGMIYFENVTATNINTTLSSLVAESGGIISYSTASGMSTNQYTGKGGRIFTGSQS